MKTPSNNPHPIDIQVLQKQRQLAITFSDKTNVTLPFSYLRANSPSAENKGHGVVNIKPNKTIPDSDVNIIEIEPVGNYAIKLVFDDGHNTGLYTWDYLYELVKTL